MASKKPQPPVGCSYGVDGAESFADSAVVLESITVDANEQTNVQEVVEQPQSHIQFIENPLPLPKKHEKKVLDYTVELTDETAEFDIEVAADDDYDN